MCAHVDAFQNGEMKQELRWCRKRIRSGRWGLLVVGLLWHSGFLFLAGWTGLHCEDDINECLLQPCNQGMCIQNEPGHGYTCFCRPGFVVSLAESPTPPFLLLPELFIFPWGDFERDAILFVFLLSSIRHPFVSIPILRWPLNILDVLRTGRKQRGSLVFNMPVVLFKCREAQMSLINDRMFLIYLFLYLKCLQCCLSK